MTKTTPKDFFLHLGATVALYAAAIALINLSFSIINYAVPDVLAAHFSSSSIAWPISMLVVLAPLLYVLEYFLHRDYSRFPEKLTLWIRRWRIYLTLFLAGATIVGDLIVLLNTYFSGELTMRFFYKILAILVIAGIIFAYYILDRIDGTENKKGIRRTFAGIGALVVLAAVIGGFVIVGSPGKQRTLRFDVQRVNDLTMIQSQIVYSYWSLKGMIPSTLADLNDSLSGFSTPVDPETKTPYEYTVKSKTSFELCATFGLPTQNVEGRGAYGTDGSMTYPVPYPVGGLSDNWKHDAGRTCFTRTIDPQKYPVTPKPGAMY